MATYKLTKYSDWNPSTENIEFRKPVRNQHNSLNINFNYLGARLYLKTPKMRLPFGIGRGMNDQGYNIQLSFDNDNEEAQQFKKKCEEFDKTILEVASKNAFDWGLAESKTKKPSLDVIQSKYKSMVRFSKYPKAHPNAGDRNPEWPDYFVVQLPQSQPKPNEDGTVNPAQFSTELYNAKRDPMELNEDNLPKQSRCSVLLTGNGYSGSTGFGVSWKAVQIMVFPRGGLPRKQCLIENEDDDAEETETQGDFQEYDQEVEVAEKVANQATEAVEEEEQAEEEVAEEEQAEEEEVEETVAVPEPPKPEPVKVVPTPRKTVAKKTTAK